MGADLYIKKLPKDKQYTGFRTDLEVGYFRDAYNNGSLLWQFDLSWWEDVIPMLKKGELTVLKAKRFIKLLKEREPIFEKNMHDLLMQKNRVWDYNTDYKTMEKEHVPFEGLNTKERAQMVVEYTDRYHLFISFLEKAIELNSPIEMSL